MRCPDCNKFVSFDEPQVEIEDGAEIDDATGAITASVRVVLPCAECGTELKESNVDMEGQAEIGPHTGDGHELELDCDDPEPETRSDGKPGTPSRYRRTYYGATVVVRVSCSCGEAEVDNVTISGEVQASGMEELT